MRYFITLRYLGTRFFGWQRQPDQHSVQAAIEGALSILLKENVEITGCGRTDTGVHARFYVAHFDFEKELDFEKICRSLNALIGEDIAILSIFKTKNNAHARFDAIERSYEYHISLRKNPFLRETAWHNPLAENADLGKMNAAAALLLGYTEFAPFCKTDGSATTTTCKIVRAGWRREGEMLVFCISANRFLRGMVRLLVGMCLQVGHGKLELDEVRTTLDTQTPMHRSISVPPQGLFLTDVRYDGLDFSELNHN